MNVEPKPVHFLLVEDDDDHADLVMRAMREERMSNTLSRVADGEAALKFLRRESEFAQEHRPDVVLLDLNLPRMSGQEVLQAVKADSALSSIPIVVITTSDAERDRVRAYESRANSYVVKPLDFEQFREMVRFLGLYWTIWNSPPPLPRLGSPAPGM